MPEQRILEAACRVPVGGAITGWAALHWQGCRWLDGRYPGGEKRLVPAITSRDTWRPQAGLHISQEHLSPQDVLLLAGVPVVSPVPALLFEARHATDLRTAVVAMDMAASADLTSLDELASRLSVELPRTGIPQARSAHALAVENSWSPAESRARLVWELDARLGRPWCNRPVFDLDGQLVGIPDLLDPRSGCLAEYEGAIHLDARRRVTDVGRERGFRLVGLDPVVLVRGDVSRRDATARLLLSAQRKALEVVGPRRWTTTLPPWWVPAHTVELRRRLTARERARAYLPPAPPTS